MRPGRTISLVCGASEHRLALMITRVVHVWSRTEGPGKGLRTWCVCRPVRGEKGDGSDDGRSSRDPEGYCGRRR